LVAARTAQAFFEHGGPDEFLDAKQKYDEERDEDRESAVTSITVIH